MFHAPLLSASVLCDKWGLSPFLRVPFSLMGSVPYLCYALWSRSGSERYDVTTPLSVVALGPEDDGEREEWLRALARVIDSNAYCLGAEVTAFEQQVCETLGLRHAIGVSSGTDALRLGLLALGVKPGDEVIVPAFTFFATASTVAHIGARPVFVDVDPDTLTISAATVEPAITDKTRAVVPVHLYGQLADMGPLKEICSSRDIRILEDAAQAFGVSYKGGQAGSHGLCGTFSFYPTKNLGAPGDAGMVVTNHDEVAETVRLLRVHGDRGGYQHEALGFNARMDGMQAAILALKLERLPQQQETRARNAEAYRQAFRQPELATHVGLVGRVPGSEHCWHQFIIRVEDRNDLREHLSAHGIGSGVHYPGALPLQKAFADDGHKPGDFPAAEAAGKEVLALPVHHRLSLDDCQRVVNCIRSHYGL